MREDIIPIDELRLDCLAYLCKDQYPIEVFDSTVQLRRWTSKAPPIFSPVGISISVTERLYLLADDRKAVGIGLGALQGPVEEVDNPTSRRLIGRRVQIFAVEVGEQHICVVSISID